MTAATGNQSSPSSFGFSTRMSRRVQLREKLGDSFRTSEVRRPRFSGKKDTWQIVRLDRNVSASLAVSTSSKQWPESLSLRMLSLTDSPSNSSRLAFVKSVPGPCDVEAQLEIPECGRFPNELRN
ncbi:hypothetical protein MTO96_037091 [Rhipicephalus appendiculatus]